MHTPTFITGNKDKVKWFNDIAGFDIPHEAVDAPEIQSFDLVEIATHKAVQAYEALQKPVLVEDTSLIINSHGQLPGPFIKWYIDSMGFEKICRLADIDTDRSAAASAVYVYFDGSTLKQFRRSLDGKIADHPVGGEGFGWNQIFIPNGSDKTLAQMSPEDFKKHYIQIKPIIETADYLKSLLLDKA
jgi:non-canonical purine NTP pyrophosphatase (RdgB/HAM1 family)